MPVNSEPIRVEEHRAYWGAKQYGMGTRLSGKQFGSGERHVGETGSARERGWTGRTYFKRYGLYLGRRSRDMGQRWQVPLS